MSQTLKSRISFIILLTLLLSLMSTMCFATEATTEPEKNQTVVSTSDIKLNKTITFAGDTYRFHTGDNTRKANKYTKENPGCGIISIIVPGKDHPIYVSGEGWISADQVLTAEDFITLKFDKTENGIQTNFNVNGEYVQSSNPAIVTYENGVLKAGVEEGKTTVTVKAKDGKEINLIVANYNGNIEVSVPKDSIAPSVTMNGDIDLTVADKVKVTADGNATATLKIENGSIGVEASGEGNVKATVADKEILDAKFDANGSATANKDGISVSAEANQTYTLLQKLAIKLNENANAHINKKEVAAEVGADASVNDKEIVSGDAGMKYEYGADDPTGTAHLNVLDKNLVNVEDKTVPVISAFKALLSKIK